MQAQNNQLAKSEQDKGSTLQMWLSIYVSEQIYALSMTDVIEVVNDLPITHVPGSQEHVVGLINVRGQIVIVVDLSKRLGLNQNKDTPLNQIVVVQVAGTLYGVLVASVGNVLKLEPAEIVWHRAVANVLASAEGSSGSVQLLNLTYIVNNEE